MKSDFRKASEVFLQEVAEALDGYEPRGSQIEMIQACREAIEGGGTLLVEAGTGTGKSFAYLIPLILWGKKSIVSTRTKNLQEQLFSKDLQFLSSLRAFDYAIAKGRSNYLCVRRLKAFRATAQEEASEYASFLNWMSVTRSGDFEEYHSGKSIIRERVCSDADTCTKSRCQYFKDCYYYAARGKWERAQIVVANHALLAVNAMMPADSKILPSSDVLVIDESHSLDAVLSDQIGINLSERRVLSVLNGLLKTDDRDHYRGLLAQSPNLFRVVESVRAEMMVFWSRVKSGLRHRTSISECFPLKDAMHSLASSVRALIEEIRTSPMGLFREDDEIEVRASLTKLLVLAQEMETFAEGAEGFVRWAEVEERRISLRMSPVYPRDFVREAIIPEYRSLVFTSATLSVGGSFGLVTDVLGLEHCRALSLPSPFDLKKQVSVVIRRGIALSEEGGIEKLAAVILEESSGRDGGVLVLFTSKDVMRRTWDMVSGKLAEMGLQPMIQGGEETNRMMLEIMRKSNCGIIFGLDSFWEGVDIKGDSLKRLIVTKLPFDVPTEPIIAARVGMIRASGGDPFREYTLPKAILKFKQGFGRLIRSSNDTGTVIVCDERIETKKYGSGFLKAVL